MTSKKVGMLKQRMKVLAKNNAAKREKNIPTEVTIDDKIKELNGRIKGCEYDLAHNFPENEMIKRKIEDYKERVKKLEEEKNNQQGLDEKGGSLELLSSNKSSAYADKPTDVQKIKENKIENERVI